MLGQAHLWLLQGSNNVPTWSYTKPTDSSTLKIMSPTRMAQFRCERCDLGFDRLSSLEDHRQWQHGSSFNGKIIKNGSKPGTHAGHRPTGMRTSYAEERRWRTLYGRGCMLGGRDAAEIPLRELTLLVRMELDRKHRQLRRKQRSRSKFMLTVLQQKSHRQA